MPREDRKEAAAKLREYFDAGDPDEIFILEEELASGSFGAVYKVWSNLIFETLRTISSVALRVADF